MINILQNPPPSLSPPANPLALQFSIANTCAPVPPYRKHQADVYEDDKAGAGWWEWPSKASFVKEDKSEHVLRSLQKRRSVRQEKIFGHKKSL